MEVDGTVADAASRLAALEQALQQAPTRDARVRALDRLVQAFPLLYGYWIKRVAEARETAAETAAERAGERAGEAGEAGEADEEDSRAQVWQRALENCPTLELWTAFLQSTEGAGADAAQRAVDALGQHFQAEPLWDAYIARCESTASRLKELLRIPLYAYSKYFQLVYERGLESADVLAQISEETAAGVTARWEFESQLTRLYFHTIPLDDAELRVWDAYLDFEESEGDAARINTLYTRCLTVTALYPGFWLRWIRWLGLENESVAIDAAFRSAFHYHPQHAELMLLYVRTLEARGELEACRAKITELGDVCELVAFDIRHNQINCTSQAYAVELAKQTGDLSNLSEETKHTSAMFGIPAYPARSLMPLWRQGLCPDARAFAEKLKADGALAEFFEVDSTLGYGL